MREREFGSPESWQAVTTRAWLERLAVDPDGADVYVLDGRVCPSHGVHHMEYRPALAPGP
jgi:hypothetical protein